MTACRNFKNDLGLDMKDIFINKWSLHEKFIAVDVYHLKNAIQEMAICRYLQILTYVIFTHY